MQLVEVVVTNSLKNSRHAPWNWRRQVDAFFVLNHDTLRDDQGHHVDMLDVGKWYLEHINKPEASHEDQFVHRGHALNGERFGL